jgi:hypothetical protein
MTRSPIVLAFLALSTLACATADARKIAVKPIQSIAKSPYSIELVGENGELLDTYQHRGRFYVNGESGERYSIRVHNPTDARIEAVISVDGLDVIDGETADYRSKRGYIVPPRGNLLIDGFRVSTRAVAAFRFSSVSNSYAGRKGKARNVGVVGVAIFAEKARPQMVIPVEPVITHRHHHDHRLGKGKGRRPAPPRPDFDEDFSADRPSEPSPTPSPKAGGAISGKTAYKPIDRPTRRQERPGLGTAFGERRHSAVSFTRFVRANPKRPTSFAELRYNDARGLQALGIRLRRAVVVTPDELATRESADPFPGTRFAQPPR